MKPVDIFRIVLVLAILAPLVIIQSGPGIAPQWMNLRLGGIPVTVVATTLWFIVMMSLTGIIARQQTLASRKDAGKQP